MHISFFQRITLFIITCLFSTIINAAPAKTMAVPKQINPINTTPLPPATQAEGYVLMDANSGVMLAEKNSDTRMEPASLTKLMTLYVISTQLAANKIHLDDPVTISEKAWKTGGSRMFVKVGTQVPVRDLIKGIIVQSGNDACVALAEHIAGGEDAFAQMMNQEAAKLGMTHSHYVDSTGLPNPDHYSTPHDMSILAQAIINHFPQYYPWYKEKWFTYNKIKQPNRNRLLWWDNSVDGLKTGHTDEAGYCLVASAIRHSMRLVAVVMKAPSDSARASDSQALINYGYRFFETHKLYTANSALTQPRVWKGEKSKVALGVTKPIYVTIPVGEYKQLTATVKINNILTAPIEKNKSYGTLNVVLAGKPIFSAPLVALDNNNLGGLWTRFTDSISYSYHRLLGKDLVQA